MVSATALTPRPSRQGALQNPLLMVLESAGGVLADIETCVNIRYGYDIQCEVGGEDGAVARCRNGWRHRGRRTPNGPSSWNGYAAAVVSAAAVEALHSGTKTAVTLGEKTALCTDGA